MINNFKKIYNDYVKNNFINYDEKQLNTLLDIYQTWNNYTKINIFNRNFFLVFTFMVRLVLEKHLFSIYLFKI